MSILAAILLWAAAGHRLLVLLRTRSFINGMYAASFVLVAAAFTVKPLQPAIDAVLGANTGDLIKHVLIVGMGAAIQLFILAVNTGRPRSGAIVTRVALAVAVAVTMIAAFVVADATSGGDADVTSSTVPYLLVFNCYLAYVLIDNVRLYRRFGAIPGDQGRAINLRLIGWGSVIALIYSATRFISIAAVMSTGQSLPTVEAIGSAAALVGVVSVALGVFAPRLIPWLADWRTAHHGMTRLNLLWSDLTTTWPAVVLPAEGNPGRRTEFAFDRRLVETSECLRLARLPQSANDAVSQASDPMAALAYWLYRSRAEWASNRGPAAADLMPRSESRTEEATELLNLADAYAAVARRPAPAAVS